MAVAPDSDRRYFTLHCGVGRGDRSDLVGREAAISSTGTRPTGSNRCGVGILDSRAAIWSTGAARTCSTRKGSRVRRLELTTLCCSMHSYANTTIVKSTTRQPNSPAAHPAAANNSRSVRLLMRSHPRKRQHCSPRRRSSQGCSPY